ncbi:MAG: hypothetical protein PHS73_01725 [Candidatus Peribacteraceae bacterium]|nr:hypothetical protein [Candidatus Peribacteraceae bacterium]
MVTFLCILGIIGSLVAIKYRERIADMLGSAEWMDYLGGPYNFIIIVSVVIFLWSISALFGITHIFLSPLLLLIPSGMRGG